MIARLLLLAVALAAVSCAPTSTLRIRAVAPGMDEAVRKVRIAMDLEGYEPGASSDPRVVVTSWKEEQSGASRITVGFVPRGRMYDVSLRVERRAGGGEGSAVGREDPVFQKWEKLLHALLEEVPRED